MLSNSFLDMLNESLTYIICKTVQYFDNNVIYLNCMRIYSLTELIEEAVKDRPWKKLSLKLHQGSRKCIFTCSELVNNISVNKERIN